MSSIKKPKPTNQSTGESKEKKNQPYIRLTYVDPSARPVRKGERLLRWREVKPRVGICRSYVDLLISQGKFPAPVRVVGGRACAWVDSEIDVWVNEQIANRKKTG
ncbi:MAG: AlpA family phage regulatory protein [Hyphomicrobiales bacterium]|nr:AlpA family phage regulatory protein [Hyphomicrobiales bacterium]